MASVHRHHLADLHGASLLAVEATIGVTGLVEALHRTIQLRPGPVSAARVAGRTRGITGFVYGCVRGATRLVGAGLDAALPPIASLLPEGGTSPERDAVVAALNGVYGDHLARSGNPLAIEMTLRHREESVDPRRPGPLHDDWRSRGPRARLLLMVHGLCLDERHWCRRGHDHGEGLAEDLGFVPVYLRYNTGLPVAENGRSLSALLERLLRAWPSGEPELVGVAHSMGGLVLRSALHDAARAGHAWPRRLRDCVFLGTPQHGAPLERAGHWLDEAMDVSPYVAPFTRLGKARSAGIVDLRHGNVTRRPGRFVPLPAGVRFHAAAATLCPRRSPLADRLLGDGLVPLDSALGRHRDPARTLAIPRRRQWIGYGLGHLDLLGSPEVYAQLHAWLAGPKQAGREPRRGRSVVADSSVRTVPGALRCRTP